MTPNIVYLHSHDTGRYIQPYGYAVPTPNLQRFAEQGVLFRQAFCAGPTCSPSRAALYTGQHPHQVGMFGLAHRGWSINEGVGTLLSPLKTAGSHTVLGGFQHITDWGDDEGERLGFDEWSPVRRKAGAQRAAWAEAFLHRSHDRPFFLDVGFGETHRSAWTTRDGEDIQWHNGEASPAGDARYVRPPVTLPDDAVTREDFADYTECARRLDEHHGRVLRAIDDAGIADSTIVVITTDHGIAFPRMKANLTDHGLGVLLMVRGPVSLGFTAGRVVDAMVSHTDLLPTVCDYVGQPVKPEAVGKSLRPLLDGSADATDFTALHDAVFGSINYHGSREIERAVRTQRYKYIRRYDEQPFNRHSCDGSTSRVLMTGHGWGDSQAPMEQLYDLTFDPTEANNLADRPGHESIVAEMRERLERWMTDTDDPALSVGVPQVAAEFAAPPTRT